MNLLLTGASGFIGKELLKQLSALGDVDIVLLTGKVIEGYKCILHKNYTFTINDFIEAGVEKIDYVIHLGAFIPKIAQDANNVEKCFQNINNTKYLIENIPHVTKKFVFASTVDVYGDTNKVIDESTQPNPISLYAASKLYCEKMIKKKSEEMGFKSQILRIGHIYGEGEENYRKIIPLTINNVITNKTPVIYSDGMEKRSFLYIQDCCRFIINTIFMNEDTDVINVVSDNSITIIDLVKLIIRISNKDIDIKVLNNMVETRDYLFNADKRKKFLGIEEVTLKQGLRIEYNYMSNIMRSII